MHIEDGNEHLFKWLLEQNKETSIKEENDLATKNHELLDKSSREAHSAILDYHEKEDYLKARKWWRRGVGTLLFSAALLHTGACVLLFWQKASDSILASVVGALTVEVLGLAAIILRHLFPSIEKKS